MHQRCSTRGPESSPKPNITRGSFSILPGRAQRRTALSKKRKHGASSRLLSEELLKRNKGGRMHGGEERKRRRNGDWDRQLRGLVGLVALLVRVELVDV